MSFNLLRLISGGNMPFQKDSRMPLRERENAKLA